jgi:hypothetical protein
VAVGAQAAKLTGTEFSDVTTMGLGMVRNASGRNPALRGAVFARGVPLKLERAASAMLPIVIPKSPMTVLQVGH